MDGYTIGQVSKILQMPTQTLRFLEENGLVSPQRDANNGYRIYSLDDVDRLIDYRWYRDAGYSLHESVDTVAREDMFKIASQMRAVQQKTQKEAQRKELIAQRLGEYAEKLDMEYLASHIGVCETVTSPTMYWCINAAMKGTRTAYRPAGQLKEWLGIMLENYCFLSHLFCVYLEGVLDTRKDYGITWGYGIERTWVEKLGVRLPLDADTIGSSLCVHTIIRLSPHEDITAAVRSALEPYMREKGLIYADDVWGSDLIAALENGAHVRYYEIWAPVQSADGFPLLR